MKKYFSIIPATLMLSSIAFSDSLPGVKHIVVHNINPSYSYYYIKNTAFVQPVGCTNNSIKGQDWVYPQDDDVIAPGETKTITINYMSDNDGTCDSNFDHSQISALGLAGAYLWVSTDSYDSLKGTDNLYVGGISTPQEGFANINAADTICMDYNPYPEDNKSYITSVKEGHEGKC